MLTFAANGTGPNFWVEVDDVSGVVKPALGNFSLVDDDELEDGDDVPWPNTASLNYAMGEAYVEVFFTGPGDTNVPFVQNVPDNLREIEKIISNNWNSKISNSDFFWVAYILGAFQGDKNLDFDPNSEGSLFGQTDPNHGGSVIYFETIRDFAVATGRNVIDHEREVVIHEVAHAVGRSGDHPIN